MSTTTTKPETATGYTAETYTASVTSGDGDGNAVVVPVVTCRVLRDSQEIGWTKPERNAATATDAAITLACQHRNQLERTPPGCPPSGLTDLGMKPEGAELTGIVPLHELMPMSQLEFDEKERERVRAQQALARTNEERETEDRERIAADKADPSKWHGGPGNEPAWAA
jgi:hypothetical protein